MILEKLKNKYGQVPVFITVSDVTGCGEMRGLNPYRFLKDSFSTIGFNSGYPKGDPRTFEADVLWLQRATHEYFIPFLAERKAQGKWAIMDLDDWMWDISPLNPAHKYYPRKELDKLDNVIKACDCLTTSTIPMKENLEKRFPDKKVFLLPNHLWKDDMFIEGEKPKNEKIKVMFSGSYCYDEDTEILTENGWKLFKDLSRSEKVATLNIHTDTLEYALPSEYVDTEYSGIMYKGNNRDVDFCVTPNHNMYISPIKDITKKDIKYKFSSMEDLEGIDFHIKKDCVCDRVVRANNIEKIEYSGRIYCVTVPYHTLYVRKNGKTMWCGNTHTNDFDANLVKVLRGLPRDKCDFYCMGFTPTYMKDFAISLPWVETSKFRQTFKEYNPDISIMVAASNEFNRCKSPLKYLEGSALLSASVGHSVYPYKNIIEHGVDGFLVENEKKDWKEYIYALIEDETLRLDVAHKAQEKVKKNFTYDENYAMLEQTYLDIFDYLYEGKE